MRSRIKQEDTASKLLFHRRKKASHSELYYFFNADQSPEYFEVFP